MIRISFYKCLLQNLSKNDKFDGLFDKARIAKTTNKIFFTNNIKFKIAEINLTIIFIGKAIILKISFPIINMSKEPNVDNTNPIIAASKEIIKEKTAVFLSKIFSSLISIYPAINIKGTYPKTPANKTTNIINDTDKPNFPLSITTLPFVCLIISFFNNKVNKNIDFIQNIY